MARPAQRDREGGRRERDGWRMFPSADRVKPQRARETKGDYQSRTEMARCESRRGREDHGTSRESQPDEAAKAKGTNGQCGKHGGRRWKDRLRDAVRPDHERASEWKELALGIKRLTWIRNVEGAEMLIGQRLRLYVFDADVSRVDRLGREDHQAEDAIEEDDSHPRRDRPSRHVKRWHEQVARRAARRARGSRHPRCRGRRCRTRCRDRPTCG